MSQCTRGSLVVAAQQGLVRRSERLCAGLGWREKEREKMTECWGPMSGGGADLGAGRKGGEVVNGARWDGEEKERKKNCDTAGASRKGER